MKYAFWVKSSACDSETQPDHLAQVRMNTGTDDIRIDSAMEGNKPETAPRIT
jgi:hypothetical protein